MLGTLSLMGGGFLSALTPINILAIVAGTTSVLSSDVFRDFPQPWAWHCFCR